MKLIIIIIIGDDHDDDDDDHDHDDCHDHDHDKGECKSCSLACSSNKILTILTDDTCKPFVWLKRHVFLANTIKHPPPMLTNRKVELK